MAVETPTKVAFQLALNNGVDAEGNTKYVNISLGSMSLDGYDGDKALAVSAALQPCLSKTISRRMLTRTAIVTAQ